jgi:CheY-like chemotaxis protein
MLDLGYETISVMSVMHVLTSTSDPPDANSSPSEFSADSTEPARPRILIVEDESFAVLYMADVITEGGYDVVGTAASARDAIAKAEAERPDLVLMDIRLVGPQDGIHAATEIYRRFGIRSIFVTAYTDPETRKRAAVANPVGFIEKPFNPETLLGALRAAL